MTTFEKLVIRALLILIRTQYVPGTNQTMTTDEYRKASAEHWTKDQYPAIVAFEKDANEMLSQ